MKPHWLNTQEYPFTSRYFAVDNTRMHYIDEGNGETILFVHGTPSWSFDFRKVIKPLSKKYRCVAIDHIGFGLSEKPAAYDYTTINHSRNLEKFILEKDLQNITLVVHDFGGPIGFYSAMRYADRIKNIVVLNSWLWSSTEDEDFQRFSKILRSPLLPFLYRYFNFSARYILPQSFGDKKLEKGLLTQYTKPFSHVGERNGPLAFAKSLLNDQDWFEELWQQKSVLQDKPILFLWGMKDPVIKPHYLQKFVGGFSTTTVHKIESAGHFPQEEEAETVSKKIAEFVK